MEEFYRRNWIYKLVSVFLAILLWLWVSNTQSRAENSLVIPLQEKGLPGNLIVTSKLPGSISVRLQGAASSLAAKDLTAYIDLSAGTKGEKSYAVVVSEMPGVKILSVEPANLTVSLDELKEKAFPVTVISQGAVNESYEAGKPVIRPAVVTVRGPEKKLAEIDQAFVEVNLANATESIQTNLSVRFKDRSGNPIVGPDPAKPIITSQPQDVNVVIPVVKKDLASRNVPVKAATKGSPGAGLSVRQIISTPEIVKIFGELDKIKAVDFVNAGTIDVTGATQDMVVEVKPENLNLPSGVSLEPGVKINLIVRFAAAPVQRTLTGITITVKNLAAGQAELSSNLADLTVKGPPGIINGLKESDVALWVDVQGMSPGQQKEVQVYAQLPPGVEAINLPKITVIIK